jgi:hypothetical protein
MPQTTPRNDKSTTDTPSVVKDMLDEMVRACPPAKRQANGPERRQRFGWIFPNRSRSSTCLQETEFNMTGNNILGRLGEINKRMDDLDTST